MRSGLLVWIALSVSVSLGAPSRRGAEGPQSASLSRAAEWIEAPAKWTERYDYVLGGEVFLLVSWVGDDDVGEGYIRFGEKSEPTRLEVIELLFGSVPDRAPLGLNRWGAATELIQRNAETRSPSTSVSLGFRKKAASASGQEGPPTSPGERNRNPEEERAFEALLNYVDRRTALSSIIPFTADESLDLHDMKEVERRALAVFAEGRGELRRLEESRRRCGRVESFLFSMRELLDVLVSRPGDAPELCYVYNATEYTLSAKSTEKVSQYSVDVVLDSGERLVRAYRDAVKTELQVVNGTTGGTTPFTIVVGTAGRWRGVPVEITYQPLSWLRLSLRLKGITRHG